MQLSELDHQSGLLSSSACVGLDHQSDLLSFSACVGLDHQSGLLSFSACVVLDHQSGLLSSSACAVGLDHQFGRLPTTTCSAGLDDQLFSGQCSHSILGMLLVPTAGLVGALPQAGFAGSVVGPAPRGHWSEVVGLGLRRLGKWRQRPPFGLTMRVCSCGPEQHLPPARVPWLVFYN